jgi:ferritin-like metal-binding protein YciE
MDIKAIERIYIRHLKEIYSAEKQILEILPKVISVITNKDLKTSLKDHLEQTKKQAGRIQKIFKHLNNYKSTNENSDFIDGLIDELEDLSDKTNKSNTLDAEIILIFQKIEHYEIACYSSVVTYARILGHGQSSQMLQESLDEEYEADNKFDKLNEDIISEGLMSLPEKGSYY